METPLTVTKVSKDPRPHTDSGSDAAYAFAIDTEESKVAEKEREAILKGLGELDDDQNAAIVRKQLRMKRILNRAIPLTFLTKTVETRLAARRLSNELLAYVPFLVLFILVFLAARDIEGTFWVGQSLGGQAAGGEVPTREATRNLRPGEVQAHHISKSFFQVRNVEEWHHWFETIIIAFFFNDPQPDPVVLENNWMAGFNLKIGAIRVRTLRVRNDSCETPDFIASPTCYGPFSRFEINETGYGHYPYHRCDSSLRSLQGLVGLYPCDGNVFEIPWNLTLDDATTRARALRNLYTNMTDIFNPIDVRFIAVEFLSYTPAFNEFVAVKAFLELTAGGRFIPTVRTDAFQVWSTYQMWHTVLWCVLYVFVLVFIGKYFRDLIVAKTDGHAIQWFLAPWNIMELINLATFLVIFGFRVAWMVESQNLNFQLPGPQVYDDRFDHIEWLFRAQIYGGAFNIVITFIKILKYVELNDQLNIVTRTLGSAGQNLVGILVIFLVVLSAYSLAATALFSNAIEEYRDFETSFSSLLRILLGDFDYAALREENRFLTGIFFWSYVILALFMLLNFFIGVIASSFQKEVDDTKAPPLHETIAHGIASLKENAREFISGPGEFLTEWAATRKSRYAEFGRLTTLFRSLRSYRMSLRPDDANDDEWALMSEEERDSVLPDPEITFADLKSIFVQGAWGYRPPSDPTERAQCEEHALGLYDYVGEKYLTTVWLGVHREFELQDAEKEAAEAEALQITLQQTTESSLRFVLGLESSEHRPTKEILEVQELFAPTAVTMKRVNTMFAAIGNLEGHVAGLIQGAMNLEAKAMSAK